MEAIWGFQRRTGVNRIPMGSLAAVVGGDHNNLCGIAYDWMIANAACFNDTGSRPDIFGLASERTESSTTTRTVSSITRSGSTATVTTTANHDLPGSNGSSKEVVKILGADQAEYNGSFIATKLNSTQFTIQVTGSPTTPATGSMTVTYGYSIYDDALSPLPHSGAGINANFTEFYKQLDLTLKQAAIDIGKPNLIVGDTAQNYSEVRSGWIPQAYFDNAGRITFDYYLNYGGGGFSASQAMSDALTVYNAKGGNKRIAWQEYGPIHTFGQPMADRATEFQAFCDAMYTQLIETGKLEEINFWVWWDGQNTSFLNKTGSGPSSVYTLNELGEVMKGFYGRITAALAGIVPPPPIPPPFTPPSSFGKTRIAGAAVLLT